MSMQDLFKLIKHYLVLFVAITIICILAGGAFGFFKGSKTVSAAESNNDGTIDQYMAQSTILVNEEVEGIGGIAETEADAWNQVNNSRYGEWLLQENGRMQEQLQLSTNTGTKRSYEKSPGSWLNADYADNFRDLTIVETQTLKNANKILVVSIGPEPQSCIESANVVAEHTASMASKLYDTSSRSRDELTLKLENDYVVIDEKQVKIEIVKASTSTQAYQLVDGDATLAGINKNSTNNKVEGSPSVVNSLVKYGLIGLVAGLLLATALVLLIDLIKKPIRNEGIVSDLIKKPILLSPNTGLDNSLLISNIKLVAGKDTADVSIASVGDPGSSRYVVDVLRQRANRPVSEFNDVGSVTKSGNSIIKISESDGVVLCMREWKDNMTELEDALNELKIARANILGAVILGNNG